jgi:small redox-active disulfide protein 2
MIFFRKTCDVRPLTPEEAAEAAKARIKVLGSGCARCHRLRNVTQAAADRLGIKERVALITDINVIAAYGILSTPALVVDEEVLSMGRVPAESEVASMLSAKLLKGQAPA